MAINGLSDFGGFYNNYKVVDIPKVDFETVKKQDEVKAAEANALQTLPAVPEVPAAEENVKEDTRTNMADLDNISLTFNANDDFSYLGSDFEIGKLDMQKAISDMKKDSILENYQFFVGSSENLNGGFQSDDGKVFLKF